MKLSNIFCALRLWYQAVIIITGFLQGTCRNLVITGPVIFYLVADIAVISTLLWHQAVFWEFVLSNCCSLAGDVRRTPNCIQSTATVCDLSSSLTDLKAVYTAVVQSQQRLGQHTDLAQGEFPFTTSPRFSPYTDSKCFLIYVMYQNTLTVQ